MKVQNYGASRLKQGSQPLGEMLPLATPLSLMVDLSNICNFKCIFCPTGDDDLLEQVGRSKGMMSLDLFRKLIDDLAAFPQQVQVLHLYKDGEPLANKSIVDMVTCAKQSGRVARVETTTNGLLLTPGLSGRLVDAGLDGIRISIYALDNAGYLDVTRTPASFERIRENVAALHACKSARRPALHVHCKIVDTGLSDEEKDRFLATFSTISDSVHIDPVIGWPESRNRSLAPGENLLHRMQLAPSEVTRKACSEPFMKLAVNYNGTVSTCCADWAHETLVGDISNESLFDIWHGDRLRQFRLKHLTGQRSSLPACGSCDYIRMLPEHSNFDALIDTLLPAYAGNDPERHGGEVRGISTNPKT